MQRTDLPTPTGVSGGLLQWIDDLMWHRRSYRQSKLRWWPDDAVLVATEHTRGRHDFTTVRDFADLRPIRARAEALVARVDIALGHSLSDVNLADPEMRDDWARLGALIDLSPADCHRVVRTAAMSNLRTPPIRAVADVVRMCDGFYFASPLLTAWELKQLRDLYRAGADVVADTMNDLLVELTDRAYPTDLVRASGAASWSELSTLTDRHVRERGRAGDVRRQASQRYTPLREASRLLRA